MGGVGGVGVRFLDETLSARTAPPWHRTHEVAIRRFLKALLPTGGSDIKGAKKSIHDLCEASGYPNGSPSFEELVRLLDTELRLITPVDPGDAGGESERTPSGACYQLTHDYLVAPLREWLTRKQRETSRGRAELLLEERSLAWTASPAARHLPSVNAWSRIHCFTSSKAWSPTQRNMMRAAGRRYVSRALAWALLAILAGCMAYDVNGRIQAEALTRGLLEANEDAILRFASRLGPFLPWARAGLIQRAGQECATERDCQEKLHAQLALVQTNEAYVPELYEALLNAAPRRVPPIRDALKPYRRKLSPGLRAELRDAKASADRRFRAGLALAAYSPADGQWKPEDHRFLAEQLIRSNPDYQSPFRDDLRPVSQRLLGDLERICLTPELTESQLLAAAHALVDFGGPEHPSLARVLNVASPVQFPLVWGACHEFIAPRGSPEIQELWSQFHDVGLPSGRRFSAGLTLAAFGNEDRWSQDDVEFLTDELVRANPDHQSRLREYLRPISRHIRSSLGARCLDEQLPSLQSLAATNAIADFFRDDSRFVAELLCDVTPAQYAILFPVLQDPPDSVRHLLRDCVLETSANDLAAADRIHLGKRRAGAAITLLRLRERDTVLPTFDVTDDPEAMTQFVHRCRGRGVRAADLLELL
jgi:hypothetical protein